MTDLLTPDERETLNADLRESEGFRTYPYRDTKGFLTIGYGTNLDAGISRRQAQALLDVKLDDDVLPALNARLPWIAQLDPVRKRAFVELAYNMGLGNRTRGLLSFTHTLAAAERGDWETAAAGLLRSKWARDVKERRATRIAEMVRTGTEQR